jgi:hypothetical protein
MPALNFEPSRPTGLSDKEVIYQLVESANPDDLFTYDVLIESLSEGLPKPADKSRVYKAVGAANRVFLTERSRYLAVVRNSGYRVITAAEHGRIATKKRETANRYIKRGVAVLQHVRLDELTPTQRQLHEGQLMIMTGLMLSTQSIEARQSRMEKLIEDLAKRVDGE